MRRIEIDCARLHSRQAAHFYLQEVLQEPGYIGRNLDALHDVLTSLPETELVLYGANDAQGYAASVLRVIGDAERENPGIRVVREE